MALLALLARSWLANRWLAAGLARLRSLASRLLLVAAKPRVLSGHGRGLATLLVGLALAWCPFLSLLAVLGLAALLQARPR